MVITVPPLRARRDDIPELAHHFLYQFNREHDKELRSIAPETLRMLCEHDWPGNVRELREVLRFAVLQASGHLLLTEFLPLDLRSRRVATETQASLPTLHGFIDDLIRQGGDDIYARAITALESLLLPRALQETRGHQTRASALLGMSRGSLRQKLKNLGFSIDKTLISEDEEPPTIRGETV